MACHIGIDSGTKIKHQTMLQLLQELKQPSDDDGAMLRQLTTERDEEMVGFGKDDGWRRQVGDGQSDHTEREMVGFGKEDGWRS